MERNYLVFTAWLSLALVPMTATGASGSDIVIVPTGSQPSIVGPASNFTGAARIDPVLLQPRAPSRLSAGYVTFEPGARSAWHTHPLGQLLVIVGGTGWVQQEGHPRQTVHAGDVIWTPPGVKHWHGATATTAMTQLAAQETVDGRNVTWMEKVSDADYTR